MQGAMTMDVSDMGDASTGMMDSEDLVPSLQVSYFGSCMSA